MMKKFITIILMVPTICLGRQGSFKDARDNKLYNFIEINGTSWMLENLDYITETSTGLRQEDIEKYDQFNLNGRYYHFQELDSICPAGWRLPDVSDWENYFRFLVKDLPDTQLDVVVFEEKEYYTSFMNYSDRINLFEAGNPLNLNPTGRIEGTNFNIPDVYADYWAKDKLETFKGRSHIHIMNVWTTIHSHKHNLQPKKKKKLRQFMVRCVK